MTASSSVGGRQIQKISCRKFFFIIWTSLSVFHSGNCRQRRVPFEYTVGVLVGRGTRRLMLARSESRSAGPAIAWWPRTLTTTQSGKNMTCGLGDPARRPVDRRYTRQWVSEWVAQGKQEETGERKRSEVTARRRHARSDLYGRLNDVRCVGDAPFVRPSVRPSARYLLLHTPMRTWYIADFFLVAFCAVCGRRRRRPPPRDVFTGDMRLWLVIIRLHSAQW